MPNKTKIKIAIDLRSLNHPLRTGINVYCLCFLKQIAKIKNNNPRLEITAIGVTPKIVNNLIKEFPWLSGVFDEVLTLQQYTQLPFTNKLCNAFMLVLSWFFGVYNLSRIPAFDYLFLIQPKILWKNPATQQICIFHDLWAVLKPSTTTFFNRVFNNKNIYKKIATQSTENWVVSLSTSVDIAKFLEVPQAKIKLVYSARPDLQPTTNLKENIQDLEKSLPKKYILALSGIEKRKNWHNLILGYKIFADQNQHKIPLILAGSVVDQSYYQELKAQIRQLDIANIIWIISPTQTQKEILLKHCLFLAYPSFYEGFGFPILEAFYHQKPVLTSRISSMPEIAKDSAIYVNPFNHLDIARGLQIMVHNHQLRNELKKNTAKNLNNFDWTELNKAIQEVLTIEGK